MNTDSIHHSAEVCAVSMNQETWRPQKTIEVPGHRDSVHLWESWHLKPLSAPKFICRFKTQEGFCGIQRSVSGACGDGGGMSQQQRGAGPSCVRHGHASHVHVKRDPARRSVHDDPARGNLNSGRRKSIAEGACRSVQQLLSRGLPGSSRGREDAPARSCTAYL